MRVRTKVLIGSAIGVAVLLAFIFFGLPPLIKHIAINKIDESTGRKSQIADLSFNPFTLRGEVTGVRLSERGSNATFFSMSSASIALSPLSLPKRTFIINELHLSSPYLHVVRNAPNSFNFSDLLAPKKEKKKKEEGTPLFSFNNITLGNGSIDFDDRALAKEKVHRVRKMAIAIPFVTDIPYLADRYVSPHFSAVINGSPIRFDGRLKPLEKAVEATLSLNVKEVDLPYYLGYVPFPLPVKVASGTFSSGVELGYRVDEKTGPELRASGTMTLEKASLREPAGTPLVSLDRAELNIAQLLLYARSAEIKSLQLDGLELYASRDRQGVWNFNKLGKSGQEKPAQAPAQKPKEENPKKEKPLNLRLETFTLKGGKLHVTDALPPGGFKTELQPIDLSLRDFTLTRDKMAPFELSFRSARGESAKLAGELSAVPVAAKLTLEMKGVPLKDYYPYLRDTLTAPVLGTLDLSANLLYNDRQGLVLEKGELKGTKLSAPFGPKEGFLLREVLVSGISADLKARKGVVDKVAFKGGNITLSSEKGGTVSAQRLLRPAPSKAPQGQGTAPATRRGKKAAPAPPFAYRVGKVTGSDLAINFTDRGKEEAPSFALRRLAFAVSGITGPKLGALPLSLSADYGKSGRIRVAGVAIPIPVRFKGNVELRGIPLRDFDEYVPENITIFIVDGALDTKLALDLEKGPAGYRGSFAGSAGVRSFYCQETVTDEDLLKWESLQIERLQGTLSPFTLSVSDVSLSNFYSRVIVEKDGTLNLQHLVVEEKPQPAKKLPQPPPTKPAAPVAPVTAGGESPAQPHPIRIDTVTVQGGTLAFSDRHMSTPFDTTFYNLGGRVSGLTSQSNRYADLDLRGNLQNQSPLSIKGTINPLRGDLYLDMLITFNDIELSPLTPYSDTYLGYNIDKGKLFLNLSYKIDRKALSSQNKVFIDQFSFGKKVDSPKATKLPVKLAIALLKDRKGEIHLDLPVAGRTDDPQFSVWKVVLQILKNLLVKAATSPIALLTSMFGGGEEFHAVQFSPGSDAINKPQQEKLAKLSQALHDRPALNLELSGYVDREKDTEGYRDELLMKKMKQEKFRALVKEGKLPQGQTPEDIEILPQEYTVYLKAVYLKEKFPKPRNFVGMVKDLPPDEMKKLIITHTVVGNNELQGLARDRVEAVKRFLVKQEKLPPERIFAKSTNIYQPSSRRGVAASRVEFGASAK